MKMGIRPVPESLTIDISAALRPGVYLLHHGPRVAYVGRARCILAALANHIFANRARNLPAWLPVRAIHFDRIEIIPCDTTRAHALAAALIIMHRPTHNPQPKSTPEAAPQQPPLPPALASAPSTIRRT